MYRTQDFELGRDNTKGSSIACFPWVLTWMPKVYIMRGDLAATLVNHSSMAAQSGGRGARPCKGSIHCGSINVCELVRSDNQDGRTRNDEMMCMADLQ